MKNYVDTISSGSVPCLENAVAALAKIENQLAVNEGFQLYEQGMENLKKDFPIDLGPLSAEHQRLVGMAEQQFSKRSFGDEESEYLKQLSVSFGELLETSILFFCFFFFFVKNCRPELWFKISLTIVQVFVHFTQNHVANISKPICEL